MRTNDDLHVKYRPDNFDDVLGQWTAIQSIKKVLADDKGHVFLLTGPSGVGKTTIARIIANTIGCDSQNLIEIDAATYTGIDAMRSVTDLLKYRAMGKHPNRAIIIDEVHALSKQAWQSLLKALEEPPSHVYFILCTTVVAKVPETIKTRSFAYVLDPVSRKDIVLLLEDVCDGEGMDIGNDVIDLISKESFGSPRRALVYLEKCSGCKNKKEAAQILRTATGSEDVLELCRWLLKGKNLNWEGACKHLKGLKDMDPESIRLTVINYFQPVLLRTDNDDAAGRVLEILDCFSLPCNSSEKLAPIMIAIGRAIYD
ncbi:hypothetical protein LCGC14_0231710 [marine sediment metagenome]|uniref:AAA+ ATPase domain-containing protein n=1 Tax=marine sediment metagenome TaxID=412755 RepID=A0A0F9XE55_9ZZZZ